MAKQRRKSEGMTAPGTGASQAGPATAATIDRERVARRAYELYLARGCGEGQELDDWLCAERELAGEDRTGEGSSQRGEDLR